MEAGGCLDGESSGCSTGCLADDYVDGGKKGQVSDKVDGEMSGCSTGVWLLTMFIGRRGAKSDTKWMVR